MLQLLLLHWNFVHFLITSNDADRNRAKLRYFLCLQTCPRILPAASNEMEQKSWSGSAQRNTLTEYFQYYKLVSHRSCLKGKSFIYLCALCLYYQVGNHLNYLGAVIFCKAWRNQKNLFLKPFRAKLRELPQCHCLSKTSCVFIFRPSPNYKKTSCIQIIKNSHLLSKIK